MACQDDLGQHLHLYIPVPMSSSPYVLHRLDGSSGTTISLTSALSSLRADLILTCSR